MLFKVNMTGATCEAGTVYPYRAPDYNPDTQSYSNKEKHPPPPPPP